MQSSKHSLNSQQQQHKQQNIQQNPSVKSSFSPSKNVLSSPKIKNAEASSKIFPTGSTPNNVYPVSVSKQNNNNTYDQTNISANLNNNNETDANENNNDDKNIMKPCDKYGLDPQKLRNSQLQNYRVYRRLLNIVVNDQTPADQIFRPNLIKQLYFLLQITPFIQDRLKDNFLNKIEQWYNSNDHKKIKLSKNLDGMIADVLKTKKKLSNVDQKQNQQQHEKTMVKRPKSGISWNKNLHPFLRPYTAKIKNSQNSQHKNKNQYRPESSKFGASTNAQTNFMQTKGQNKTSFNYQQQCMQQFQNEMDESSKQRQICDIQQQWQRSLDFKKKHRTLHPQQQPTYQKLMNLVTASKPYNNNKNNKQIFSSLINENKQSTFTSSYSQFNRNNINANQNMSQNQKLLKSNPVHTKQWENKRKIQSAILNRQMHNAKMMAQQQIQQEFNNNQENKGNGPQYESEDQRDDFQRNNEGDDQQYNAQDEDIDLDQKDKKFTSDNRSRQGRKLQSKNKMYTTLNGAKILRPLTAKQMNIIKKLDQISTLQQNKRTIQHNIDEECIQKFKQYSRKKNSIKRQISRKNQSKRYMQNFREVVKVLPNNLVRTSLVQNQNNNKQLKQLGNTNQHKNKVDNVILDKCDQIRDNQQVFFGQNKNQNAAKNFIDFTQNDVYEPYSCTYNVQKCFSNLAKQKVVTSCRNLKQHIPVSFTSSNGLQQLPQPLTNKMTYQKRINSQQRFDPMSKNNLIKYNNQCLQQIQKIKQRFGGKIAVSTDNLIKALYVDAPIPFYQKQKHEYFLNKNKNQRFDIPDKAYLMVQKQEKKKKKRKLKKGSNNLSKNKRKLLVAVNKNQVKLNANDDQ